MPDIREKAEEYLAEQGYKRRSNWFPYNVCGQPLEHRGFETSWIAEFVKGDYEDQKTFKVGFNPSSVIIQELKWETPIDIVGTDELDSYPFPL